MNYKGFVTYPLDDTAGRWLVEYLDDEIYADEESAKARVEQLKSVKRFYLVKYWSPHRGGTEDNPTEYQGPGAACYKELSDVKPEECYESWKIAKRVADKHNRSAERYCCSVHYKAIEVPEESLAKV